MKRLFRTFFILAFAAAFCRADVCAATAQAGSEAENAARENVNGLVLKTRPPKFFMREVFGFLRECVQDPQIEMTAAMFCGAVGYPNFAGVSESDAAAVSMLWRGRDMKTVAEVSAREGGMFAENAKRLFGKNARQVGERVVIEINNSPEISATAGGTDLSAPRNLAECLVVLRTKNAFDGLPFSLPETLKRILESAGKIDASVNVRNRVLEVEAVIEPKKDSDFARKIAEVKAGEVPFINSGNCALLKISSNMEFGRDAEFEAPLPNGVLKIETDGRFVVEGNSAGGVNEVCAVFKRRGGKSGGSEAIEANRAVVEKYCGVDGVLFIAKRGAVAAIAPNAEAAKKLAEEAAAADKGGIASESGGADKARVLPEIRAEIRLPNARIAECSAAIAGGKVSVKISLPFEILRAALRSKKVSDGISKLSNAEDGDE